MKKNLIRVITPLMCGAMIATMMPSIVMADSSKIVTLGADLSDADKQTMMNYFKVDSSQVTIITVTNSDEKSLLGSYIPASQIGTNTLSCAYVNPTTSGGIKVRTANLNYVTCNMLASALMTAGVSNAEVVAACPYNVSGTGALTGVMLAYEESTGTQLDSSKKELATKELVTTGKAGDRITDPDGSPIGRDKAILIINEMKYEILTEGITDHDAIYERLAELVSDYNYQMNEEDAADIMELLIEFADMDYEIRAMAESMNTIEENLSGQTITESVEEKLGESTNPDATQEVQDILDESASSESDSDTIMNDTDESVLGENVVVSDSDNPEVYEETVSAAGEDAATVLSGFEDVDTESTESTESTDGTDAESTDSDSASADQLDETAQYNYDLAATFADGEFAGDADALASTMGSDFIAGASLDADTAANLKAKFLGVYEDLLKNGFVQDDSVENPYMTTELNVLKQQLLAVFGLNTDNYDEASDVLAAYDTTTKQALYDDTMKFFENLYGESTSVQSTDTTTSDDTTTYDDGTGETYSDDSTNYDSDYSNSETYTDGDGSTGEY